MEPLKLREDNLIKDGVPFTPESYAKTSDEYVNGLKEYPLFEITNEAWGYALDFSYMELYLAKLGLIEHYENWQRNFNEGRDIPISLSLIMIPEYLKMVMNLPENKN